MLKAVIFDYNGVLVDDIELHEEAYWLAGREFGIDLSRETLRRYISYPPEEKRMLYYGKISDEAWSRLFQLKTEYYFDLAEKDKPIFPEVEPLLMSLSSRYVLGLISNTPRNYFERVLPRELAGLFKETMFVDEIRNPKPSPDPLLEMICRFGIHKERCCYVGDSVLDVLMAKAAGIKVIGVTTGDSSEDELQAAGAHGVIDRLSALPEKIEALV